MNELLINKRTHLFLFLWFFVSLITSSLANEIFNFQNKSEFDVEISSSDGNKYLEYLIFGNDTSVNYVLSAYDNPNKTERIQLGQSYFGKTKLYLSIEDYEDKIYFDLECASKYNCSGEKKYSLSDSINLIQGEPINYFVNKEDEIIYFSFHLKNEIANIWARGQYNITTEVSSNFINKRNIGNSGEIYIIKNDKNGKGKDLTFKVIAQKGDYINVGFIEYDNYGNSISEIENEGPAITGYLNKNVLNKICYNIKANEKNLFGKGIIFTKYAKTYLKVDNEITDSKFTKEYFYHQFKENISQFCLTFPDEDEYNNIEEIVFTYEIENPVQNYFINKAPQLNGIFNPGVISKGSIAAYISHKNGLFDIMSFKLSSLLGFPKMNIAYCKNYPFCLKDIEKTEFTIRNINRFSGFNILNNKTSDNSPISKNQTLFIVECKKNEIDEEDFSDNSKSFCEYNTLIYTNNDVIQLQEDHYFNQYVKINHQHEYKIKLSNEISVSRVLIDILIYIGEVEINTEKIKKLKINLDQFEEINKLYISIKIDKKPYNDLYFSIKGLKNSYYTILVSFVKNEKETGIFITNKILSGIPYLVTLQNEKYIDKTIQINKERELDNKPFMVNFYSINCITEVKSIFKGKDEPVEQFGPFGQEIIDIHEEKYKNPPYEYKINVIEPDGSSFFNNLCKVYVSSIEITEELNDYSRDILLPDNTPQQVQFGEKSNHITFGYTHADFSNDLLIKFNLIHTAKYIVRFYYENKLRTKFDETTIVANNLIYLESDEWLNTICWDNKRVCYIQIDITLVEFKVNLKPILEISVKSMGSNFVSYISKNELKMDYVQNTKSQYYYTEIGKNEKGFISINFLRGSGRMYSKIIKMNIDEPEEGANWRGKYVLPFEEDEDMKMDPFTKKTRIQNTDKCRDGCYLLLKVFSDVDVDKDYNFVNYPYTIIINTIPSSYYDLIPPVKISIDQYIVGAVTPYDKIISEFYSVWLKYDANFVVIDFQTNTAAMSINFNDKKPTLYEADIKFLPTGQDTIHNITKEQILENYNEEEKKTGLRDKVLTIGIWSKIADSMSTTPFSFVIRLENYTNNDDLEIYRVNSDQKVLCQSRFFAPNGNKRKFRCLYAIAYDNIAQYSVLFGYASAQNKSASLKMYANIINSNDYEMDTTNNINIPNYENFEFSCEDKRGYLYINKPIYINEYILVSVEVDIETTIEFISTVFILIYEITPNPFSYQLFNVYDELIFNFPSNYMELVNIICVGGSGEIYWDNDKSNIYYLNGKDEQLTITSSKSNKEHKLKMISTAGDDDFIIIVKYKIRKNDINFDPLNLDRTINFAYSDSDFPIALYCPLNTFNKEKGDYYDVVFTFLKFESTEENYSKPYEVYPFKLLGFIVKESTINNATINPGISPVVNNRTIQGIYDNAMRAGLLRINEENLKISNENLFLYLKIDKTENMGNKFFNNVISFETTVFHKNAKATIFEISNHFGYLDEDQNEINYVLRNDLSKNYMNLEFSCEDDNLLIEIENMEEYFISEKEEKYGKQYYHLPINDYEENKNLIIRRKNTKENNVEFFSFRYTFSENITSSKYNIDNTKINVTQTKRNKKANYTINLTPVSDYEQYDIIYIVRLKYDKNKKMPSKSNIVLSPDNQKVVEFNNPTPKYGKLELEIINADSEVNYVQVIVQIKAEDIEYLSYDLQSNNNFKTIIIEDKKEKKEKDSKDSDKDTLIIIIAGAILVVIAIILVFIIFKCKKKNKDLLEKVNKVSFSVEDRKDNENEDLLLNK